MNMLNPGMGPPAQQPMQAQTPQSQYLTAALKSLAAQPMASGAQVGEGLLSQALLQSAQATQPGSQTSDPFAANKPLGGLMGLGKQLMSGWGGGNGG